MRTFFIVWGGQLVSVVGTTVTGFALQIWVYLETGSVTSLALVSLFATLPAVLLSPIAGALVDRWDRRLAMLGADVLAGIGTLVIAVLFINDALELWHIYVLVGVGAIGNAFQMPAWLAAMPMLVPKRHLGRANGLVQMNDGISLAAGPAIAGTLLVTTGLGGVLLLDVATFLIAVGTLAAVRFPRLERTAGEETHTSIRTEIAGGWRFIRERTGLLWLLFIYAGVNFVLSFTTVLLLPMILSFSNEGTAGAILSAGGFGLIAGSVLIGIWGGPKHRIAAIMGGIAATGLFIALAGVRPNALVVGTSVVLMFLVVPVVNTSSQVLWQTKVPLDMQGRVFSLRRMLASLVSPLAILAAGPLADRVFEPLMAEGGALAHSIGALIDTGKGRGIALLVILSGLMAAAVAVLGWMHPRVRHLEKELPDVVYYNDSPSGPMPVET
jgi:MFS family permease